MVPKLIFQFFFLFSAGSGSGLTSVSAREVNDQKCKISQLTSENRELTSALVSCQDELSHLNEKVILAEDSHIKLKTKLEELTAETELLVNRPDTPLKSDLEHLLRYFLSNFFY